jgi:ubiquitin-conjugating enzyme E2 D
MFFLKRIKDEIKDFPVENIVFAGPEEDNLHHWSATLLGVQGTPYFGGAFALKIVLPEDYPMKPPKINFTTPIFHPNVVLKSGLVCLNILGLDWSPALTISKVLLSILALMGDPNFDDPINRSAASMYRQNKKFFIKQAREYTKTYAF